MTIKPYVLSIALLVSAIFIFAVVNSLQTKELIKEEGGHFWKEAHPILSTEKPNYSSQMLDFRISKNLEIKDSPNFERTKENKSSVSDEIKKITDDIDKRIEERDAKLAILRKKLENLMDENKPKVHKSNRQDEKSPPPPKLIKLGSKEKRYTNLISHFSKMYNIDHSLILAIIKIESNFRPYVISDANAVGLMQVVPKSAGIDVKKTLQIKEAHPTTANLKKPKTNIHYGTAYLWLLKNKYLKDIKDPESKKHVAIASYNGGVSAALKAFSRSKKIALKKINSMHPDEVLRHLAKRHQSEETRNYVQKVALAHNKYSELLN